METVGTTPRDHLSVSQINLYLLCPRKYAFTYVEKIPRAFKPIGWAFGSAIHSSIEWLNRQRKAGKVPALTELIRIFEADWNAQKVENLKLKGEEDEKSLIAQGKELLSLYHGELSGKAAPQSVELPFQVELCDFESGEVLDLPLEGVIDLVERGDTVVEIKTSSRSFSPIQLAQHLQITAYAYAYEVLYRKKPSLVLETLLKGKRPRIERAEVLRSKDDHLRFFHIAKAVLKAIRSGNYHPNPGWQCQDCEFFDACQRWRG